MNKSVLMILLLLLGAALFAQTASDTSTALPVDPELIMGKLPNGLTYYIKVNHKPEKRAELRLVTNIGSVQEDDDQQGLAHFTEHMAFNGTRNFKKSELVDYMNSIGMGYANGLNAGTGLDQTTYQLQLPTDNAEQFRKGFLILSDWANGVSLDTDEINKERGVIVEEWRMGQGANQRIYDAQRKVIFAGSRYAERMPIGKLEVLQNFTPDTIRRFYSDWYRPDLQAVVAVGDFDPKVVENLIKEYFSAIPAKQNPRDVILYDIPDHVAPKVTIVTDKEATDADVQLNWKHPRTQSRTVGDFRHTLVTNLYTQMLNMRLAELAQKADPPYVGAYTYNFNMVRSKSTYVLAAMVAETGILTGYKTLLTEAERVRRFGFTASEFERAKQIMLRTSERMLAEKDTQDSDRLVWRYVSAFSYDNPVMSIEQNYALNQMLYAGITLADVNGVISELITDNNLVIAVSAPEKEGLVLPTEKQMLDLLAEAKSEEITAYVDQFSMEALFKGELKPGKVVKEKKYKKVGIKQWKLSNGITVLAKQTDFKNDEILLQAFSPGGTSMYGLEDLFEAREAANIMVEGGVNGFSSTVLQKKLAGKIVKVEPFINSDNEGFTGNSSKADLETMFQLIYLYATQPRIDEESFTSWISREQAYLQNQSLDPESDFSDSLQAFQYNHNPRVRTMHMEDLPSIDPQKVIQVYLERFGDFSDFTFVFVGNFEEKQLKEFCRKYLANLPAKGIKEQVKDNGVRFVTGKQSMSLNKGLDAKSVVRLTMSAPCVADSKINSRLRNLTLLMDEKLRENIREARSGVYFIGSWGSMDKYPIPTYNIDVYMQCAPDRAEELSEAVLATLDSLKAGLFTEKYVNVVKTTLQKSLETNVKENRWWLRSIYNQAWNGFPLNNLLADKREINSLNLKVLQQTAAEYLIQNTSLVKGVLYPASKSIE